MFHWLLKSRYSILAEIPRFWFARSGISKITIPAFVSNLGESYFRSCKVLKEVAFEEDSRLAVFGKNCVTGWCFEVVEVLRLNCFHDCNELGNVKFEAESRLERIERFCFEKKRKLTRISIPKSVVSNCRQLNLTPHLFIFTLMSFIYCPFLFFWWFLQLLRGHQQCEIIHFVIWFPNLNVQRNIHWCEPTIRNGKVTRTGLNQ
jgi:hypothetical protein